MHNPISLSRAPWHRRSADVPIGRQAGALHILPHSSTYWSGGMWPRRCTAGPIISKQCIWKNWTNSGKNSLYKAKQASSCSIRSQTVRNGGARRDVHGMKVQLIHLKPKSLRAAIVCLPKGLTRSWQDTLLASALTIVLTAVITQTGRNPLLLPLVPSVSLSKVHRCCRHSLWGTTAHDTRNGQHK